MDSNNNGGTLMVTNDRATEWEKQRPSFSYATLIWMALENSPTKQLSLQDIYAYFNRNFIYFKENPTRWKSSVRHCLSSNKCFIKIPVEPGKHNSHLWALDPYLDSESVNSIKLKTTKRPGPRKSKLCCHKPQLTSAVDEVQHGTSQNQNLQGQIRSQAQEWEHQKQFVELKSLWDGYNLHDQYNYQSTTAITFARHKEHDSSSRSGDSSDGYQNGTDYVVGTNGVTTTITNSSEIPNTDGGIGILISDVTNGITSGVIGSGKSSYIDGRTCGIGDEINSDKSDKTSGGSGDCQDQFDYGCLLSDNDCIMSMRIYTAITAI